ncbi:TPA: hypothetical protein NJ159_001935 [Vibrio parahaemolyticus]|nr:hypothetical protein [Vibrio parahaemolyticus]
MNKQLTKNTVLLLIRTGLTIILSLYITRLALELLGVESYGLYSVVSSITSLMSFFSSSLSSSTQRCVSYYLGARNMDKVEEVVSGAVIIHLFFAISVSLVAIIFGGYYIDHYLNIEANRIDDALFILFTSVFTICIVIIGSPFIASLLSFEKIKFYTLILLLEVITRFILVVSLSFLKFDDVKSYALVMSFTLSIPSVLAMFYCIFKLKVNFSLNVKRSCYREIISLTTWNSFGTLSYVLMTQGGTILINSFYGVALNAARAASLQVQSALLQVSNSAQAAVNPRIVKLYSAGEIVEFSRLLFRSTKYIYLLLLLFSVPIFVNSDELVSLWLKNAPNFTSEFVRYIVLINLVNSISFGIMAGVQATGNIKNYQLIIGGILLLNLPVSYFFMELGFSPLVLFKINFLLSILALLARFYFIKNHLKLDVSRFLFNIIIPIFFSTFVSLLISMKVTISGGGSITILICNILLSLLITLMTIIFIALNKEERKIISEYLNVFIKRLSK